MWWPIGSGKLPTVARIIATGSDFASRIGVDRASAYQPVKLWRHRTAILARQSSRVPAGSAVRCRTSLSSWPDDSPLDNTQPWKP
jgi:hypothetical protein